MPFTSKCSLSRPSLLEESDFLNGTELLPLLSFTFVLGQRMNFGCRMRWYYLWHKIQHATSLGFWIKNGTYPYWTTPISGPPGPMSRVWATSARNCFWIRNRRLPMLELPSIKNDKSILQSEEWKRSLLFWWSLIALTRAVSPLFLHHSPLRIQCKERKK